MKTPCILAAGALCSAALPVTAIAEQNPRMETMVVTANRFATRIADAPASISVVSSEELKLIDADDLAQALALEPGINIVDVGQSRRGISIRGMPVEHTLYLIDGRRISSSNSVIAHSDFELNWLPDSAIEQVEIVRGPMSSLYGSDALGGVVNIITKQPGDRLSGEVSVSHSQLESYDGGEVNKASAYLSGPLFTESLGFTLSGESYEREELPDQEDESVSEVEQRESQSLQGSVIWNPREGQRITLNYIGSEDERARGVASRGGNYVSEDDIDRSQTSLSYQGEWQWGFSQLNAYDSKIRRENTRDTGTPTRPQEVSDQVLDGYVRFDVLNAHSISVGGQAREETLKDAYTDASGESSAQHLSAFVQDEWQVNEALQLVAGLGLDNHEQFGNELSPRIYAVYDLNPQWVIKGGYGSGFRAPSLTELSEDFEVLAAGGLFWVEGNPDLEPERSETIEISTQYTRANWLVSLTLFENQLENLVQTLCYVDCGIRGAERRRYENVDEARIRGAEASALYDINEHFNISINYTALDAENRETGESLEDRPDYRVNAIFSWLPLERVTLRWRSQFVGEQYVGNDEYTPAYDLHSIDASFDINTHFTLYANVENVFDENLREASELYSLSEPGREFNLGVNFTF